MAIIPGTNSIAPYTLSSLPNCNGPIAIDNKFVPYSAGVPAHIQWFSPSNISTVSGPNVLTTYTNIGTVAESDCRCRDFTGRYGWRRLLRKLFRRQRSRPLDQNPRRQLAKGVQHRRTQDLAASSGRFQRVQLSHLDLQRRTCRRLVRFGQRLARTNHRLTRCATAPNCSEVPILSFHLNTPWDGRRFGACRSFSGLL